jgi:hypothetical protein
MEGQKGVRNVTRLIQPGQRVRLREDAFKHVKTREWTFTRIEKENEILLMHENGLYGLIVGISDIDWQKKPMDPPNLKQLCQE